MFPINFTTYFTGPFYSTGRNGDYLTTGVKVSGRTRPGDVVNLVDISGINSRGMIASGDIQLSAEAMDQLCAEWIKSRGLEFTGDLSVQRMYGEKRILIDVLDGNGGVEIKERDGIGDNIMAALDPFYVAYEDDSPKDGFFQVSIFDPADTGPGPVACAVYTDEGVKIHVGDGGDTDRVEEFDNRQGIVSRRITDRYYVSPNVEGDDGASNNVYLTDEEHF